MKTMTLAFLVVVFTSCGCQSGQTAPAVYRFANVARLNAVKPWLTEYSADHPDKAVRVGDVVRSWELEVNAQRAASAPTTQP